MHKLKVELEMKKNISFFRQDHLADVQEAFFNEFGSRIQSPLLYSFQFVANGHCEYREIDLIMLTHAADGFRKQRLQNKAVS